MPYGNDEWIEANERAHEKLRLRSAAANDAALRAKLASEFHVPPEFMDVAVRVWWNGKED